MNLRIGLYCLVGGLSLTIAAMGAGHFVWWWLSGIVLAASFVPVARLGPQHPLAQFGAILPVLLIVGGVCTESEAAIFLPGQKQMVVRNLLGSIPMYLIAAGALTLLAKVLKLTEPSAKLTESSALEVARQPAAVAALGVGLSGLAYVVYYLVFGSITFWGFTRHYYPPHAERAAEALGLWFWVIQLARGVLMTLAVLPLIYTLRMRRWHAALAVGALLWVVGGAAPLLVPNPFMVPVLRFIHTIEILTQNAPLGITAVLLLRPKATAVARSMQHAGSV